MDWFIESIFILLAFGLLYAIVLTYFANAKTEEAKRDLAALYKWHLDLRNDFDSLRRQLEEREPSDLLPRRPKSVWDVPSLGSSVRNDLPTGNHGADA